MNYDTYIRRLFVKQLAMNDCGIACIRMLLNYAGKDSRLLSLPLTKPLMNSGFSLLELKEIARDCGLDAKCVALEMTFLREINSPFILLTGGQSEINHYQVCFGARKTQGKYYYLLADPARSVYMRSEAELEEMWPTRTALFVKDLKFKKSHLCKSSWELLFTAALFPGVFWISIPLISLFSAFSGFALSIVIQQGVEDPLTEKRFHVLFAIIMLLFIISLCRGVFTYLKQRILITLSNVINERLFRGLSERLAIQRKIIKDQDELLITKSILEISKVQQAVDSFLSVLLSDSALVILISTGVFYYSPAAGLSNFCFAIVSIIWSLKTLSEQHIDQTQLTKLSGDLETGLLAFFEQNIGENMERPFSEMQQNHALAFYTKLNNIISIKMGRHYLRYEILGTMNVILVFANCLLKIQQQHMTYPSLMFLVFSSYLITTLIGRICNSFFSIDSGATAFRQHMM